MRELLRSAWAALGVPKVPWGLRVFGAMALVGAPAVLVVLVGCSVLVVLGILKLIEVLNTPAMLRVIAGALGQ